MAGTFKFHSKLHRDSHHTIAATSSPDAATDPIASQQLPFAGIFYNDITDVNRTFSIPTNSLQWYSVFATVKSLSTSWNNTFSLYTTVNQLSNNWNAGFSGYVSFLPNSGNFTSTYTTVSTFSAQWSLPNVMYVNIAQEYTGAKTFSGTDLTVVPATSTINWILSANQNTFLAVNQNLFLNNPQNMRKGGVYVLTCTQSPAGNFDLKFDTCYRFNGTSSQEFIIDLDPNNITIITFVSDGILMYGDVTKFNE